ncbi:MAG: DNA-binding transcriptional regulator [Acidobacteria bacterium]|nr:DNA-binding transcriptional regulator [Acidobacteriota bacterium]
MKKPKAVILLIPSAREFDRGLRRGIIEYAHTHGPWIFHEEAPPYLQRLSPKQRMQNMRAWHADGMIVIQSRYAEVRSLDVPTVVAVGSRTLKPSFSQVVCADEEIGREGARVVLSLGLRNFAYCGLNGLEFSDNRGKGFQGAILAAGFRADFYSPSTEHLGQSWYREQKLLGRWLMQLRKPVGLLACNDDRARVITEICRLRGIRVPDDVAILGVDNDEQVCRSSNPPISSIALATERGGYEAAALLAKLMSGRTPARGTITVHPTQVVRRQSTDILAIQDQHMVRALRFIRDHSHRNLRVSDVLLEAGLSRRALQDKFTREVGRSPIEEIHQCRVDRICRLLLGTNMTIREIALACGFEIDAHVARFFSRRMGMTPLAYRKKLRLGPYEPGLRSDGTGSDLNFTG